MELIVAILLAFVIHEGGHWLAARCFGKRLKFRFAWGKLGPIPVPRLVWEMPMLWCTWHKKTVALAGFGAELVLAAFLLASRTEFGFWYAGVALTHFVVYRFYAGEESDFRWL